MILNQWYAIYPSVKVKKGQVVGLIRINKRIALFRGRSGTLGCVVDRCSHRGAALGLGKVHGEHLTCPFHGIEFDYNGKAVMIPALGKASTADMTRFQLPSLPVREAHGIIYLWYGEGAPAKQLPFFAQEVGNIGSYSEFEDHWNAFYSRCIENQLDVIHLPFVHGNTIGRGNKTLVNGPKVIWENGILRTSANNEIDQGQSPQKEELCEIRSTYLNFVFPNLWYNHISDKIGVLIYFAPVDDENTVLYIRFYSRLFRSGLANRLMASVGSLGNRIVERQDKRVVVTQTPSISTYRSQEKLLPGDSPIIQYRKIREELQSK